VKHGPTGWIGMTIPHRHGGKVYLAMPGEVFEAVKVAELSPAEPPQTIEQFGRTYRLDEGGRTDKERLDWLEVARCGVVFSYRDKTWAVGPMGLGALPHAVAGDLRSAIDAAITTTAETTP